VLYARVSGDDTRKDGRNLNAQIDMCREYALEKGWQVVAELAEDDRGASGASLNLPQLNRLREMARDREIDVIVVREIDRFSRTLAKQLIIEEELKRFRVEIEYVLGEYPDTPEGNLNKNIKAVIAEYERVKIAERMNRGKRLKVQTGHIMFHGHRPYGYKIVEIDGRRTLQIHEPEARIVRRVYQWYTEGDEKNGPMSIRGITAMLTRDKVPTYADLDPKCPAKKRRPRGAWAQSSVRNMLSQETYAGVWYYGKRKFVNGHWVEYPKESWIPVEVPPIVARDVWEAAQARRAENRKLGRPPKHQCLMRRRLWCAECGCKLQTDDRSRKTKSSKRLYLYYACKARKLYALDCSQRLSYRVDHVDAITWNWVRSILSDPHLLRRNLKAYQDAQLEQVKDKIERLDVVSDLVQEHSMKLQKLLDLYLEGNIDKELLIERKQRLEAAVASLNAEHAKLKAEVDADVIDEDVINSFEVFAAEVAEGMLAADEDFAHRRRIVELLGVTGTIAVEEGEKILRLTSYVDNASFGIEINTTSDADILCTDSCCISGRSMDRAA
jgi:site-specific DNA recombinase